MPATGSAGGFNGGVVGIGAGISDGCGNSPRLRRQGIVIPSSATSACWFR
jgi:hypothetical protein